MSRKITELNYAEILQTIAEETHDDFESSGATAAIDTYATIFINQHGREHGRWSAVGHNVGLSVVEQLQLDNFLHFLKEAQTRVNTLSSASSQDDKYNAMINYQYIIFKAADYIHEVVKHDKVTKVQELDGFYQHYQAKCVELLSVVERVAKKAGQSSRVGLFSCCFGRGQKEEKKALLGKDGRGTSGAQVKARRIAGAVRVRNSRRSNGEHSNGVLNVNSTFVLPDHQGSSFHGRRGGNRSRSGGVNRAGQRALGI